MTETTREQRIDAFLGRLRTFLIDGEAEREDTLTRLLKLLDNRIEGDGDGWPTIPPETLTAFWSVVIDLGDLCFAADGDGDSAIKIIVSDMNRQRLHYFFEERAGALYDIEKVGERESAMQIAHLAQIASSMSSTADQINRSIHYAMSERCRKLSIQPLAG